MEGNPRFGMEEQGKGWAGVEARQALNIRLRSFYFLPSMTGSDNVRSAFESDPSGLVRTRG